MADMSVSTDKENDSQICFICETAIDDVVLLGEKHTVSYQKPGTDRNGLPIKTDLTITCHYFCLLFSCKLEMNGHENEGIRGFLPEDIVRERNRGRTLTCYFCQKWGPTSACCEKTCKVSYHLPCALYTKDQLLEKAPDRVSKEGLAKKSSPSKGRNSMKPAGRASFNVFPGLGNTFLRFVDPYETFCSYHRPPVKTESVELMSKMVIEKRLECTICHDKLTITMICRGRYFFIQCPHCFMPAHLSCVREYAKTAGEAHFKCCNCNCSIVDNPTDQMIECQQKYVDYCRRHGVYVPVKDADWEEDATYFEGHNKEYSRCDVKNCQCPDGREFDQWNPETKDKTGEWYIAVCTVCAGSGAHRRCANIAEKQTDKWACGICREVLNRDPIPEANPADLDNNNAGDDDDGERVDLSYVWEGPKESAESMVDLVSSSNGKRPLETSGDQGMNKRKKHDE